MNNINKQAKIDERIEDLELTLDWIFLNKGRDQKSLSEVILKSVESRQRIYPILTKAGFNMPEDFPSWEGCEKLKALNELVQSDHWAKIKCSIYQEMEKRVVNELVDILASE